MGRKTHADSEEKTKSCLPKTLVGRRLLAAISVMTHVSTVYERQVAPRQVVALFVTVILACSWIRIKVVRFLHPQQKMDM